jgi:hypothetical protein
MRWEEITLLTLLFFGIARAAAANEYPVNIIDAAGPGGAYAICDYDSPCSALGNLTETRSETETPAANANLIMIIPLLATLYICKKGTGKIWKHAVGEGKWIQS